MKNPRLVVAMIAIVACVTVFAENKVEKQTLVYSIENSDTLRLDRYCLSDNHSENTLIFAFGGSFKGGERDNKEYIPFFYYLAENGINVVSIDYRTTLGKVPASQLATIPGFVAGLQEAITTAVTDLYKATGFVMANSEQWGVNPGKIVLCGSSAGAITVLQAENVLSNGGLTGVFPDGFNYAGVVSFAGAVCAVGEPVWTDNTCPLMLFHGDADTVVPYDKAVVNNIGLWGSKHISDALNEKDIPHVFHTVMGFSHNVCVKPMNDNREEILRFINEVTSTGTLKNITVISDRAPGVKNYKTDFTLEDYLKANK